jgi:hypothetical protein
MTHLFESPSGKDKAVRDCVTLRCDDFKPNSKNERCESKEKNRTKYMQTFTLNDKHDTIKSCDSFRQYLSVELNS